MVTHWTAVESQFNQSWRHNTSHPEVRAVYKIVSTETSLQKYQNYLYECIPARFHSPFNHLFFSRRESVERRGNFSAMNKARGNENRRWHGTRRKCNIGDPGTTSFCANQGCSLCCIIRTSFDLTFFKKATGWGRFGAGIYTSSTSSKFVPVSSNMLLLVACLTLELRVQVQRLFEE